LRPIVEHMTEWAKLHPHIVQVSLALVGAAAAVLALGAAGLILTSTFGEGSTILSMLKATWTLGTRLSGLRLAFRGLTSLGPALVATFARVSAAMLTLDTAALLNPIGLTIAAVAALAVVGYEIYEHWDQVKELFSGAGAWFSPLLTAVGPLGNLLGIGLSLTANWEDIGNAITGAWDAIKGFIGAAVDWGAHFVDNFVNGIKSGIGKLHDVMTHIGDVIKSYLPFSSAETGPLRDLNRVRIVETIADTMKPMPMLDAMRRVTMAMVAAPMVAMPGISAAASLSQPIMSRAGGGATEVTFVNNFHFAITNNGGAAGDVVDELEKAIRNDKHRLVAVIDEAMEEVARKWNRTGLHLR
jgi:hypothetical protein